MARNVFKRFQEIAAGDPLRIGLVTAHNSDGTSTLQTPTGNFIRVRGQDVAIGLNAFYRNDRVETEAPTLPPVTIDV